MDKFRSELLAVRHFDVNYYNELLNTIDNHIEEKPDITIETCKAIIEGLSTLILMELNQTPESYFKNPDLRLPRLFKEARACLKEHIEINIQDIVYDDALIETYGSIPNILEQLLNPETVARIGVLRNDHGDISHGRTPLKIQVNDPDLAELIVGLTDNICSYMLRKFIQVKEDVLLYEDHPDFNDSLDEQYPFEEKVLYSRALFDQAPEGYRILLNEYNNQLEELEE